MIIFQVIFLQKDILSDECDKDSGYEPDPVGFWAARWVFCCCFFVLENVNSYFCWLLGGKVGLAFVVLVYFCFGEFLFSILGSKVGLVFAIFLKYC